MVKKTSMKLLPLASAPILRNAALTENSTLKLRAGNPDDAQVCGEICYRAFKTIAQEYNFPSDFPTVDVAQELMSLLLDRSDIYSVVAEVDEQIVGSNFLWGETIVAGIGPLTVDPTSQNASVGKHLMAAVLERAGQHGFASVRLVQAAYNNRSLALYTKLGFDVREPLVSIQGQALRLKLPGYSVRLATADDLAACNRLCQQIHGFDRNRELSQAIDRGTATVVEYDSIVTGIITGYATAIGFFGHAVGESNEDLQALIGAATSFTGQGFLLPTRNSQLLRWCLQQGLRIVQPMTLMSLGLYERPAGAFLPSILF
jgi:ribosomal protein S18 acetylase RimI-like enzyme